MYSNSSTMVGNIFSVTDDNPQEHTLHKIKLEILFICPSAYKINAVKFLLELTYPPPNQTTLSLENSHPFSHAQQPCLMTRETKAISFPNALKAVWRE